jgi:hypothetical protein
MKSDIDHGIGEAWLSLAANLEQRLRERDPEARVRASLSASGLLQLEVHTIPAQRASARALARHYEERARSTCERCGGRVSVAGAGAVVTIVCAHCSTEA